ncbi:hypothetical protein PR048_024529 [Dryococelus australis]|uniref:Uncharacterized protein n=1 Tax=Dryococelus australis TaxID=614101 RepID=A0ABQ9GNW7_9NEOP|nr:hypothetical protein PR048_024529 [Dryococelus australis]
MVLAVAFARACSPIAITKHFPEALLKFYLRGYSSTSCKQVLEVVPKGQPTVFVWQFLGVERSGRTCLQRLAAQSYCFRIHSFARSCWLHAIEDKWRSSTEPSEVLTTTQDTHFVYRGVGDGKGKKKGRGGVEKGAGAMDCRYNYKRPGFSRSLFYPRREMTGKSDAVKNITPPTLVWTGLGGGVWNFECESLSASIIDRKFLRASANHGRLMLGWSGEIWTDLNVEVLRADEDEARWEISIVGMQGRGEKSRSPRKHADQRHRLARFPHVRGEIPGGLTPPGIEPELHNPLTCAIYPWKGGKLRKTKAQLLTIDPRRDCFATSKYPPALFTPGQIILFLALMATSVNEDRRLMFTPPPPPEPSLMGSRVPINCFISRLLLRWPFFSPFPPPATEPLCACGEQTELKGDRRYANRRGVSFETAASRVSLAGVGGSLLVGVTLSRRSIANCSITTLPSWKGTLVVRDWLAGVTWSRRPTRERKAVVISWSAAAPRRPYLQTSRPAQRTRGAELVKHTNTPPSQRSEVTFAIGSQFVRPALHASEPICRLARKHLANPITTRCGATANEHTAEAPVCRGLRSLAYSLLSCHVAWPALASHLGEPGSIPSRVAPEFLHVGIVPDDIAGRRVSSGIPRFPRPCIPALLRTHLTSPPHWLSKLRCYEPPESFSSSQLNPMRGIEVSMEQRRNERAGETGDPRDRLARFSHAKIRSGPAGD